MNIVGAKTEIATGSVGLTMAAGPGIKSKIEEAAPKVIENISGIPFHETNGWLGFVAVLGAIFVAVSAANAIIRLIRNLRRDEEL